MAPDARSPRRARRPRRGSTRPYRGKTPEERRRDRAERLIQAGFELFTGKGYGQTTIEGICARAGVTARNFYDEFESREALLLATVARVHRGILERVESALEAAGEEPFLRLDRSVRAVLEGFLDDPRKARLVFIEAVGVSPSVSGQRHEVRLAYAQVVAAEANRHAERKRRTRDLSLASVAALGAIEGLIQHAALVPQPPSIDALHQELMLLLVSQIEGEDHARSIVEAIRP